MRIGILGAGNIGSTLAIKLASAGHEVTLANSRGPSTVPERATSAGAIAVSSDNVASGVDVLIVSVPFAAVPRVASVVRAAPTEATVIDTGNYYPHRDGDITGVSEAASESVWAWGHYQRPFAKAWNSLTTHSLSTKGAPAGSPCRIALPVSGSTRSERRIAANLVEETGFDAVEVGDLAASWTHQPGTPAFCTDLTREDLIAALSRADASFSATRRDAAIAEIHRLRALHGTIDEEVRVSLNRAFYR